MTCLRDIKSYSITSAGPTATRSTCSRWRCACSPTWRRSSTTSTRKSTAIRTRKVITGGPAQVERLKGTLREWLRDLLNGPYDNAYVTRRWRVGRRHVEIGLDQVYTNVALSRLRRGLLMALEINSPDDTAEFLAVRSLAQHPPRSGPGHHRGCLPGRIHGPPAARERMATIGQVAGGIAHELRNPLNVVKTSIYFLRNARNPSPAKTAEHLQRIERHVVAGGQHDHRPIELCEDALTKPAR